MESKESYKSWTEVFRPRTLREVKGQEQAVFKLSSFVKNFYKQNKKAALLHGPSGCGKTSLVHAFASEFGFEILEMNASDMRNREKINTVLGEAMRQKSLSAKSKILLIDEVDALSGTKDYGGLSALTKLFDESAFPVIMTTNDLWQKKLNGIRTKTEIIQLNPLLSTDILDILSNICKKNNIKAEKDALIEISTNVDGDARAAINDLYALALANEKISMSDVQSLEKRAKDKSIFEALKQIFQGEKPNLEVLDSLNIDLNECFMWLDENLPFEYDKEDLLSAYDAMSKADIFRKRITRWQHWRFLVYMNAFMTAGINSAKLNKSDRFVSYKRPSRILKMWMAKQKNAEKKQIAEKFSKATHCSLKRAMKDMFLVQMIIRNNPKIPEELELNLNQDAE